MWRPGQLPGGIRPARIKLERPPTRTGRSRSHRGSGKEQIRKKRRGARNKTARRRKDDTEAVGPPPAGQMPWEKRPRPSEMKKKKRLFWAASTQGKKRNEAAAGGGRWRSKGAAQGDVRSEAPWPSRAALRHSRESSWIRGVTRRMKSARGDKRPTRMVGPHHRFSGNGSVLRRMGVVGRPGQQGGAKFRRGREAVPGHGRSLQVGF